MLKADLEIAALILRRVAGVGETVHRLRVSSSVTHDEVWFLALILGSSRLPVTPGYSALF